MQVSERVRLLPVLIAQKQYIEASPVNKKNQITKYTGYDKAWVLLQSFLRKPTIDSYSLLLKEFKTVSLNKKNAHDNAQNAVNTFNSFIKDAPTLSYPINVYRATGDYKMGNVGDTVTDWSISGASLIPDIAAGFAYSTDCCLYEFTLPANSHFLFIGYDSQVKSEFEVLLPAGSMYKINGTREQKLDTEDGENTYKIYECELVGYTSINERFEANLEIDRITKSKIKNEFQFAHNTFTTIKRLIGEEKAILSARKKINDEILPRLHKSFLSILSKEELLDIFFNDTTVDTSLKEFVKSIMEVKEGGKTRRRKTKHRRTQKK